MVSLSAPTSLSLFLSLSHFLSISVYLSYHTHSVVKFISNYLYAERFKPPVLYLIFEANLIRHLCYTSQLIRNTCVCFFVRVFRDLNVGSGLLCTICLKTVACEIKFQVWFLAWNYCGKIQNCIFSLFLSFSLSNTPTRNCREVSTSANHHKSHSTDQSQQHSNLNSFLC